MIEFLNKPLTVERVLAAYAKTGLKPRDGLFAHFVDGAQCACALGAVAIAEGVAAFDDLYSDGWNEAYGRVEDATPGGFITGFDDLPFHVDDRDREAYELGQACRKAVGL